MRGREESCVAILVDPLCTVKDNILYTRIRKSLVALPVLISTRTQITRKQQLFFRETFFNPVIADSVERIKIFFPIASAIPQFKAVKISRYIRRYENFGGTSVLYITMYCFGTLVLKNTQLGPYFYNKKGLPNCINL